MTFNSFVFALGFFPVVYVLYLALRQSHRAQNFLLLCASYLFYGYWSRRFLALLLMTTAVDFTSGLLLSRVTSEPRRKAILGVAVGLNLVVLGIFKYFNFFAEEVAGALTALGLQAHGPVLDLLLPVGISFYTFQSISYSVDVYRRRVLPTANPMDYALYVAFFPHLVAGPIQRAALLDQIAAPRKIDWSQINAALFLLLWGYFKKVVIADNCAQIVNEVFNNYSAHPGLDVLIGVVAFTLQIYGDFSGYSDIARGLAKLMGFELMVNFKLPYFATGPSDFWSRWHISLSTWLRDYLYIPLGGNRKGRSRTYSNLAITMLLGGLWHGAAANYLLWGAYHGLVLIVARLCGEVRSIELRIRQTPDAVKAGLMLIVTAGGWFLFRARSLQQVQFMLAHLTLTPSPTSGTWAYQLLLFGLPLALMETWQYRTNNLLVAADCGLKLRVPVYAFLLLGIMVLGVRQSVEFIYFQF